MDDQVVIFRKLKKKRINSGMGKASSYFPFKEKQQRLEGLNRTRHYPPRRILRCRGGKFLIIPRLLIIMPAKHQLYALLLNAPLFI